MIEKKLGFLDSSRGRRATNHQKTIKGWEGMWSKIHRQLLNSWLKRI